MRRKSKIHLNTTTTHYTAQVLNVSDYYSFGSEIAERSYDPVKPKYRYGYNTQEKVLEINKDHYTAKFWEYDARLSRRWNVDPKPTTGLSDYAVNTNNPIKNNDPEGDCDNCPKVSAGVNLNVGTHNNNLSFNLSITQTLGKFSLSAGVGIAAVGTFNNTGKSGLELRGSLMGGYQGEKGGLSLGTNVFKGWGGMKEFSQRTGILNFNIGKFSASYENDGTPFPKFGLSDGGDSYRTAAVRLGWGQYSAGFNLFTGLRKDYRGDKSEMEEGPQTGNFGVSMPHGFVKEEGPKYRMGAAYVGYGSTKLGIDSDRWIRHPIQDIGAHHYLSPQPGFETLSKSITPYVQLQPFNIQQQPSPRFTLYGNN